MRQVAFALLVWLGAVANAAAEDVASWSVTRSGEIITYDPYPPRGPTDGAWQVACTRDAMTDAIECQVTQDELDSEVRHAMLISVRRTDMRMAIGGQSYPGSATSLRIDGGAVVSRPVSQYYQLIGADAALYARMRSGSEMRIRWVGWPYRNNNDDTVLLAGFVTTIDSAREFVRRCSSGECVAPSLSEAGQESQIQ